MNQQLSITCPRCTMTSHHPQDIQHGYCGNCHAYTCPPQPGEPMNNTHGTPNHPTDCRCHDCTEHRRPRHNAPQPPRANWPRRLRIARNLIALALTLAGGFAAGDNLGDLDDDNDCEQAQYDD